MPPEASVPEQVSLLIIDDDLQHLRALRATLEPLGHRILIAPSGEAGLAVLREVPCAVVLLDLRMPGFDGFATAKGMRKLPYGVDVPIVFVTGDGPIDPERFESNGHGAIDWIEKPVSPQLLRSKVRALVDLFQRGARLAERAHALRQRELAQATQQANERLVHVLEAMPLAVLALRPNGSVSYTNPALHAYLGGSPTDRAPLRDVALIAPEDRERVAQLFAEGLASGTDFEFEARLRRHDGTYRWHRLNVTRPASLDDELGILLTAMDIDAHKRAETLRAERLTHEQVLRRQADEANRTKDEFIASVSHELRAPLHAILGWTKMLRQNDSDARTLARALATIDRNAQGLAALVDDLLDVSRVVAGKFVLESREVNLDAVVQFAVDGLVSVAANKRITLTLTSERSADTSLIADPQRLHQIVTNLVSNALKFTPEGGRVEVGLRVEGQMVELYVRDNGIGIPKDFLPHAFDRFSQEDASRARRHGGLGLGLWITRHLVELHGGSVSAESAGEGLGATFVVAFPARLKLSTLPPAPIEAWSNAVALVSRTAHPLAGLSIVVVDDDEDARDLLQSVLERVGVRAVTCADAESALRLVIEEKPALLVSDIGLPESDGYELIARVRRLPPTEGGLVPAIALSGYARSDDRARALAAGFQAHLAKPVALTELLALAASFVQPITETRTVGAR